MSNPGARRVERLDDAEEALLRAFSGFQASLWTALPAVITKVDLGRMVVEAQPVIQARVRGTDSAFTWTSLPVLVDVPLVFPSGGGFMMTFPVATGDECLVIFASRCIDAWWQSGGVQIQADLRLHDLSDGFALVGPRSQPRVVPGISTTDVVLRNESGSTRVSLKPSGEIELATSTQVTMNAAAVVINAPVTINGAVNTTGALTNNGKDVGSGHRHPNGSPNTGTPI